MNKSEVIKLMACLLDEEDSNEMTHSSEKIKLPETVIIRTVTHYYVGRVTRRDDTFIELDDASWVASTGRWSDALTTGSLDEVEPFPNRVLIALGSVVDVAEWGHKLPRDKK